MHGDQRVRRTEREDAADDSKELTVAKRKSTRAPKTAVKPRTKHTPASANQSRPETMADSVAVFIGKNVGKAVKQTRALGTRLSEVGTELVDAGSRAGQAVKGYLPEVLAGKATKPRRKAGATEGRKRKMKTATRRAYMP